MKEKKPDILFTCLEHKYRYTNFMMKTNNNT